MPLNPFDFFRDGYHQGLIAVASFIDSGKTFEQWYGVEPNHLDHGWSYVLEALNRKEEYDELKKKIEENHGHRL